MARAGSICCGLYHMHVFDRKKDVDLSILIAKNTKNINAKSCTHTCSTTEYARNIARTTTA